MNVFSLPLEHSTTQGSHSKRLLMPVRVSTLAF
ncbi:hypothetical protein pdam_00014332 [Pocillopora damicornis]|uniref:Uncharacterized protein n=1 Tax=Pocillopora damicornis TaxID=46731 RepID=A0A3M6U4T0_POCDA|nr:hypothetical protein pdam_00014332 [Pocillopora damicornis]